MISLNNKQENPSEFWKFASNLNIYNTYSSCWNSLDFNLVDKQTKTMVNSWQSVSTELDLYAIDVI